MDSQRTFIVCGGGTAGVMFVRQLLKLGHRVVLIDCDLDSNQLMSAYDRNAVETKTCVKLHSYFHLWPVEAFGGDKTTYRLTTAQSALVNRTIKYPYKLGLGGNSNINAMIFDLGHYLVYDQYWPRSWNYTFVKRYAKMVNNIVSPHFQSSSGSMKAILEMLMAEAESLQSKNNVKHPYFSTMNQTGLQRLHLLKLLGKLGLHRLVNLTLVRARVDRFVLEKGLVTSIVFEDNSTYAVSSNEQVILSCGALLSPSIIFKTLATTLAAPAVELRQRHEPRHVDEYSKLKDSLGNQLWDHFVLPLICFGNWYSGWRDNLKDSKGTILSYPLNGVHGWVFLDKEGNYQADNADVPPVCQLVFVDGSISAGLVENLVPPTIFSDKVRAFIVFILKIVFRWSIVRWLVLGNIFGVLVCLVQPKSRGKYSFDSENVMQPDPQFLVDEYDQQVLHKAFLRAQVILEQARSRKLIRFIELLPGFLFKRGVKFSDFNHYFSLYGTTYFHPCGTLPMEVKSSDGITVLRPGVVNEQLLVKGTKNLRVVDASVFPHIPAAPIAKMCMVLGVAAADIVTNQV